MIYALHENKLTNNKILISFGYYFHKFKVSLPKRDFMFASGASTMGIGWGLYARNKKSYNRRHKIIL